MKKIILIIFIFTCLFCYADDNNRKVSANNLKIGDDISDYLSEIKTQELTMCSSSQFYPSFKIYQDGIEYIIAFSKNKVVAIFCSSIIIDGILYETGKSTVEDIIHNFKNYNIVKEEGFGYVLKTKNTNFIVLKDTQSQLYNNDIVTMICKV